MVFPQLHDLHTEQYLQGFGYQQDAETPVLIACAHPQCGVQTTLSRCSTRAARQSYRANFNMRPAQEFSIDARSKCLQRRFDREQDIVAGDGTTSVVVLCGALLKKALELLERGVHPTIISDSFNTAVNKAVEVRLPASASCQAECVNCVSSSRDYNCCSAQRVWVMERPSGVRNAALLRSIGVMRPTAITSLIIYQVKSYGRFFYTAWHSY